MWIGTNVKLHPLYWTIVALFDVVHNLYVQIRSQTRHRSDIKKISDPRSDIKKISDLRSDIKKISDLWLAQVWYLTDNAWLGVHYPLWSVRHHCQATRQSSRPWLNSSMIITSVRLAFQPALQSCSKGQLKRSRELPPYSASPNTKQGTGTDRTQQTVALFVTLAQHQPIWFQAKGRYCSSADPINPDFERCSGWTEVLVCGSSLLRLEKGFWPCLAQRSPG